LARLKVATWTIRLPYRIRKSSLLDMFNLLTHEKATTP